MGSKLNELKKIVEICVQHQIIEVDGGGYNRISPLFIPILISNMKRYPSILDAIAFALRAYCPTAGVLELSLMATLLTDMISRRSGAMGSRIKDEMVTERAQMASDGEEMLKERGINTVGDVLKEIETEKDMK